jgi:methyltransferase
VLYYLIWSLFLVQRLGEMVIAKKNLALLSADLIAPIDLIEKRSMLILHASWFMAILIEFSLKGEFSISLVSTLLLIILLLCQWVRWLSIKQLKGLWVPFPVSFKHQHIVQDGIYKWIRHPNYLVVIIEILLLPLLGKCYITAILFSIINLIFILKRIQIEEAQLSHHKEYKIYQQSTHKLVPFIY